MSQLRAKELQEDYDEECSAHDRALNPIFGLSTGLCRPIDLKRMSECCSSATISIDGTHLNVSNNESTESSSKVQPGCALSASFRVGIKKVSADCCCGNNGCKVVHCPADSKNIVGISLRMVQSDANEVVADELEGQDQPEHNQPVFRIDAASVALRPELSHQVEYKVSNRQSQDGSNNRGGINGCQIAIAEVVSWDDQD